MRIRLINGKYFQILKKVDSIPGAPIQDNISIIETSDGEILYFDEAKYSALTIDELHNELEDLSKISWRNEEYKKVYLKHHLHIYDMMKSFIRDKKIDDVLNKNEFDPIILAC